MAKETITSLLPTATKDTRWYQFVPKNIRKSFLKLFMESTLPLPVMTVSLEGIQAIFKPVNMKMFSYLENLGNERKYLEQYLAVIKEGTIVFDIGAYIGTWSILGAKKGAKVFSFEPVGKVRKVLETNIKLNHLTGRIKTFEKAIDESNGPKTIFSQSFIGARSSLNQFTGLTLGEQIQAITLDSFIAQEKVTPDVLKIDIEGGEVNAIKGAQLLFSGPKKPDHVFVEVHPDNLPEFHHSAAELKDQLNGYNYQSTLEIVRDNTILCHYQKN